VSDNPSRAVWSLPPKVRRKPGPMRKGVSLPPFSPAKETRRLFGSKYARHDYHWPERKSEEVSMAIVEPDPALTEAASDESEPEWKPEIQLFTATETGSQVITISSGDSDITDVKTECHTLFVGKSFAETIDILDS